MDFVNLYKKYDDSLNINANKDTQNWNLYYIIIGINIGNNILFEIRNQKIFLMKINIYKI